ncbi:MAG TPA: glycosyltransferase family 39 protein [Candidatus Krumholzibacteria bacterium]|nr:glycosyltransferase family 39 protein [Candidatus Krumholzibacteria bacterium]
MLIALIVAIAFQGSRGLFETTEGRYAEVAREMVATGDWITPRLDGAEHWSKPPLAYWTIALGIRAAGPNGWGVRGFNIIAFLATVLATCGIGAAMWDRDSGRLAALVTATAPFMVVGLNSVSTDMPLAMWEVAAVFCFWSALRPGARHPARWVNAMWIAFGLAFLTKGPPGLLPLAVIAIFAAVVRRRGQFVPRLVRIEGLAFFLVLAFGWYALVVARDPSLAGYFLGEEVWGRVATSMHHRNPQWYKPLVIYILPLSIGLGFWFFDALPLAVRARGRVRRAITQSPAWMFLAL